MKIISLVLIASMALAGCASTPTVTSKSTGRRTANMVQDSFNYFQYTLRTPEGYSIVDLDTVNLPADQKAAAIAWRNAAATYLASEYFVEEVVTMYNPQRKAVAYFIPFSRVRHAIAQEPFEGDDGAYGSSSTVSGRSVIPFEGSFNHGGASYPQLRMTLRFPGKPTYLFGSLALEGTPDRAALRDLIALFDHEPI